MKVVGRRELTEQVATWMGACRGWCSCGLTTVVVDGVESGRGHGWGDGVTGKGRYHQAGPTLF